MSVWKTYSLVFLDNLNKRALSPFSLVYYDIWGPSHTITPSGFKYLLPPLMIIFNELEFG